jgi:hypothetical protein
VKVETTATPRSRASYFLDHVWPKIASLGDIDGMPLRAWKTLSKSLAVDIMTLTEGVTLIPMSEPALRMLTREWSEPVQLRIVDGELQLRAMSRFQMDGRIYYSKTDEGA